MKNQIVNQKSTSLNYELDLTTEEVKKHLNIWGEGLVEIATAYRENGDYKKIAQRVIKRSYDYDNQNVLFKPTLASKVTFRTTFDGALSYFVGGDKDFAEDNGFALNPWKKVEFDIAGITLEGSIAIVMGNKLITKTDDSLVVANFTMVFKKYADGDVKIIQHHSSLPYKPA